MTISKLTYNWSTQTVQFFTPGGSYQAGLDGKWLGDEPPTEVKADLRQVSSLLGKLGRASKAKPKA